MVPVTARVLIADDMVMHTCIHVTYTSTKPQIPSSKHPHHHLISTSGALPCLQVEAQQAELDKLGVTLRQIEEQNEAMKGEITATRQAAYAAEEAVSRLEREKLQQDLLVDNLQVGRAEGPARGMGLCCMACKTSMTTSMQGSLCACIHMAPCSCWRGGVWRSAAVCHKCAAAQ
jgi:hypothetical protein